MRKDALRLRLSSLPSAPPGLGRNPKIHATFTATDGTTKSVAVRLYWPVLCVNPGVVHGFREFEVVRLSDAPDAKLNGDFAAVHSGTSDFWCLVTNRDVPAVSGSVRCAPVYHRFDEVMRNVPANSIIHVGQGIFETRGVSQLNNYTNIGWLVKHGQKLRGAGMDVTTLKLVYAFDYDNPTVPVGRFGVPPQPAHIEVSDLTLDANLSGQPVQGGIGLSPVTCGGAGLTGDHHRLSRLRAVNWGCQGPLETFVLGISSILDVPEGVAGNVIEDCVIEKPGENSTHESTLIANVGHGVSTNSRSPIVRHNFCNLEYSNGLGNHPIPVTSLARHGVKLARLVTAEPHRHILGKNLVVRGALIAGVGTPNNPFNGVFEIVQIESDTALIYRMYVDPAPGATASGATIGHGVSSEPVAIKSISYGETGNVTVTTARPHNRTRGQFLTQAVALPGKPPSEPPWPPGLSASHHRYHTILEVLPSGLAGTDPLRPDRLEIQRPDNIPWPVQPVQAGSRLGATYHGPAAWAGTGCVIEGNQVYDCLRAFYTDTGSTRDVVARDNYYSNTFRAVDFDFNPVAGGVSHRYNAKPEKDNNGFRALTRDVDDHQIAVFESESAHGLREGDAVRIDGARINGTGSDRYNGNFVVLEVTSSTRFKYRMSGYPNPDQDADPSTPDFTITFQARWQVRRLMYEGNICELNAYDQQTSYTLPNGLASDGYHSPPPFTFPGNVFRGNFLRMVNNAPEKLWQGNAVTSPIAFGFGQFEKTVVEDNVVELKLPWAIHYGNSDKITAFDNWRPDGSRLSLYNTPQAGSVYNLEESVDERIAVNIAHAMLSSL